MKTTKQRRCRLKGRVQWMMGELSKSFHNIARDRAACALAWEHFTMALQTLSVPSLHTLSFIIYGRGSLDPTNGPLRHSPLPLLLSFLPCLIFISVLTSSFTEKYPVYPAPSLPLLQRNIPTRSQSNQVIMTQLNERRKDIAAANGSVRRHLNALLSLLRASAIRPLSLLGRREESPFCAGGGGGGRGCGKRML